MLNLIAYLLIYMVDHFYEKLELPVNITNFRENKPL